MRPANFLLSLLAAFVLTQAVQAQNQPGVDSTGLPGDNFSLQGALELFQKASSPEEFEKMLNSEDNHVNNLDLNGDGEIDYIKVIDMAENDEHAFVLQVPVSENESQDIAVIELEKTGKESAVVQIVGDEGIYGEQVIVEPNSGAEDESFIPDMGGSIAHGPAEAHQSAPGIIVNVWFWPTVRYVYAPNYVVWRSPWRWRHYPGYWKPWRPLGWHAYHPYCVRWHRPFVVVHTHRVARVHRFYTPARVTSVSVRTRHYATVNGYRVSRTKTTVTGPRGHKATRTTTTVRGKGGHVKGSKTTVRRRR